MGFANPVVGVIYFGGDAFVDGGWPVIIEDQDRLYRGVKNTGVRGEFFNLNRTEGGLK